VQRENVKLIKNAVFSMLKFSGNYSGRISVEKGSEPQRFFSSQDYIRVPESGIFYSMLKSGDEVRKNQILGYITDEFGNRKKRYYFTVRRHHFVQNWNTTSKQK